jgi:hypothetical protein
VVPGAPLRGNRFACDQVGCPTLTCHPALPNWQNAASLDQARIANWWRRCAYGVLLATGHTFDVLEVAGPIGRRVARVAPGPVAVAPPHRWMFLIEAGAEALPALAEHPSVVLHHAGSWIPAPPTPLPTGNVRWHARPRRSGWRPADPLAVQRAAARLLRDDRQPRQAWQLNRAAAPTTG